MKPQFAPRTCRPRDHVVQAGQLYPQAWRQADELRAGRGVDLPNWPTWCYLPLAGAYSIVSAELQVPSLSGAYTGDVGRLGALLAWRMTQGIYRFDPAVYEAVRDTPISGDIPHEVLHRLPEWCVYIETPGQDLQGSPMHGCFAHLEWDANTARTELRLLLDTDAALLPVPLHLGAWSLAESLDRMAAETHVQAARTGATVPPAGEITAGLRPIVEPLVSLLLYLCTQAGEIGAEGHRPHNPEPTRTKRGWRLFQPDRPTTWDVGLRLGAALRRAYQAEQTGQGGTHAGPRPHIRRAHWHGFWSGPLDGARRYDLRWLPPIPVAVDPAADLPAVIRPVR